MRKEEEIKEIWFNEMSVKIVTYEGMYYTVGRHTKEEIEERKREWEEKAWEESNNRLFTYKEIIESFISDDLAYVMGTTIIDKPSLQDSGLIWLPYEYKILNRKEIKESLIQFI